MLIPKRAGDKALLLIDEVADGRYVVEAIRTGHDKPFEGEERLPEGWLAFSARFDDRAIADRVRGFVERTLRDTPGPEHLCRVRDLAVN